MTMKKDKLELSASTVAVTKHFGQSSSSADESSNLLSYFIAICALQQCLQIVAR